jgi:hypothetical protein
MMIDCKYHGSVKAFNCKEKNGIRLRCAVCIAEAVKKRRSKVKEMALEYKGGKCERCGYDKCKSALAFHHLDPTKKDFGISAKGHTRSWNRIQKELDKCILVCLNCHAEIHEEERNIVVYPSGKGSNC